jgi:Ca2+-binding EF-hand superfamily protein
MLKPSPRRSFARVEESIMSLKNSVDSGGLLYLLENLALAQLAKGQPDEFWTELGAKLDASADGTITIDDFIEALREEASDE